MPRPNKNSSSSSSAASKHPVNPTSSVSSTAAAGSGGSRSSTQKGRASRANGPRRFSRAVFIDAIQNGKRINLVSRDAEFAFYRILLISDQAGLFVADPYTVLTRAFGRRAATRSPEHRVCELQIREWMSELARVGLIRRFVSGDDGQVYGVFWNAPAQPTGNGVVFQEYPSAPVDVHDDAWIDKAIDSTELPDNPEDFAQQNLFQPHIRHEDHTESDSPDLRLTGGDSDAPGCTGMRPDAPGCAGMSPDPPIQKRKQKQKRRNDDDGKGGLGDCCADGPLGDNPPASSSESSFEFSEGDSSSAYREWRGVRAQLMQVYEVGQSDLNRFETAIGDPSRRGWTVDRVRLAMEYTCLQPNITNPRAYLVRAIEQGYAPTKQEQASILAKVQREQKANLERALAELSERFKSEKNLKRAKFCEGLTDEQAIACRDKAIEANPDFAGLADKDPRTNHLLSELVFDCECTDVVLEMQKKYEAARSSLIGESQARDGPCPAIAAV